jgi:hypothetical protein
LVLLEVTQHSPGPFTANLVDADGNVVSEVGQDGNGPPDTDFVQNFLLGREAVNAPWRLVDTVEVPS